MTYTERTQAWLDERAARAAQRLRAGYEPLYLGADRIGRMPVGHVIGLARTCAILTALATEEFACCLDVGSGGGRLCHLVERLFGAVCAGVDLSREFAEAARRDFGVPVYVANAAALPFADAQFDVVLCSEVIEHVEHPLAVLAELWRVARRTVLVTTQECCRNPWQRRLHMAAAERAQPHGERNYFIPDDFRRAFGDAVQLQALLHLPERIRLFRRESMDDLADCVRALTAERRIGPGSFGVLVVARKVGAAAPPRAVPEAVLRAVLETDRRLDALAARRAAGPLASAPPSAPVPAVGTPAPVCPECGGGLVECVKESQRESAVTAGHGGEQCSRPQDSSGVVPAPCPTGAALLDPSEFLHQPVAAVACRACAAVYPVYPGGLRVPRLLASAQAVARRQQGWEERADLAPLRRALAQRPLPWRHARSVLRWALKVVDFLRLPLPWRDKLRLARMVWRERDV